MQYPVNVGKKENIIKIGVKKCVKNGAPMGHTPGKKGAKRGRSTIKMYQEFKKLNINK